MTENFPAIIREAIGARPWTVDKTGMSDSMVLLFDDMVLKVEPVSPTAENEYRMLTWLKELLPVPRIYAYAADNNRQYLLLSRVSGHMACDSTYMANPGQLVLLLAEALEKFHSVDIRDCPTDMSLNKKLALAGERVSRGLVDMTECAPETFGPGAFRDPEHLLSWLTENRPPERPVLTHGDFCLPNVLFQNNRLSGYIDLGLAGTGDPLQDIALCWRSLMHNARGDWGRAWPGFEKDALFSALGISPDWDRIRYYLLLDELF